MLESRLELARKDSSYSQESRQMRSLGENDGWSAYELKYEIPFVECQVILCLKQKKHKKYDRIMKKIIIKK